jgi:hypothetical protein
LGGFRQGGEHTPAFPDADQRAFFGAVEQMVVEPERVKAACFLSGKVNSDKKTGNFKVVHCANEEAVHRQTEGPNRA